MPHQNTSSSKATAQNAATDPTGPRDIPTEEDLKPEPRAYAAPDVGDSTLAPPAAGEVADYMDEGDPLEGEAVQQGANHANRPGRTEVEHGQGPKTRAANRAIFQGKS
ncbi:hypothetical protein D8I30_06960 [Brevundimonas naejangsanensis]|uniref:Uncharacterized protein n=1 Tax=Brevundimonas naejangsanensis TaxID=588932 RepID=A0A494RK81_9CAUL|nr:hypothetical protein [Brevundimonas naejangsanensis]AYG94950.1 hypothetical protein D8I30_06960 [Brevundimonas naejangsanensis]